MIIRPSSTRGFLDAGWISSARTFSNNSYFDPRYQRWNSLRVINDDCQQPGNMVPKHKHDGFDILGYMISGELDHWDNLGNQNRAIAGQIQHMYCGTGIYHTEASVGIVPARYLQIWIINKLEHRRDQPYYELLDKSPEFALLPIEFISGMKISGGTLSGQHILSTKCSYVYVVSGTVTGDDFVLSEGDGAELDNDLIGNFDCHLLMFEQT